MEPILPPRFLFRYAIPVHYRAKLPGKGRKLLALPEDFAFPDIAAIEQAQHIGELRLAWNESGFGISLQVRGKRRKVQCDVRIPETSDGLQIWIDTRNTQTIHRASRFCHYFCLLPTSGAGVLGKQPAAVQFAIARAKEDAPLANPGDVRIASDVTSDGYTLEAWFPARALHGFDPEANPRLGFYYAIRDHELGNEHLSVGHEFPVAQDPSLWATLELVRP